MLSHTSPPDYLIKALLSTCFSPISVYRAMLFFYFSTTSFSVLKSSFCALNLNSNCLFSYSKFDFNPAFRYTFFFLCFSAFFLSQSSPFQLTTCFHIYLQSTSKIFHSSSFFSCFPFIYLSIYISQSLNPLILFSPLLPHFPSFFTRPSNSPVFSNFFPLTLISISLPTLYLYPCKLISSATTVFPTRHFFCFSIFALNYYFFFFQHLLLAQSLFIPSP